MVVYLNNGVLKTGMGPIHYTLYRSILGCVAGYHGAVTLQTPAVPKLYLPGEQQNNRGLFGTTGADQSCMKVLVNVLV